MIDGTNPNKLIAFIVNQWPPLSETFIANEIRGIEEAGADVVVFALNKGAGRSRTDCPSYYRPDLTRGDILQGWKQLGQSLACATHLTWTCPLQWVYALRNAPAAMGFARVARDLGVNHIHGHFMHTTTDIALMMGRQLGIPVTSSAHAWDVYCTGSSLYRRLDAANHCITCTRAARSHILSHSPRPVENKISVVHHGVDLGEFPFQPTYRLSPAIELAAVGRLVCKKGFEQLIRACRRLRHKLDVHCTIAGDGPMKSELSSLVSDLQLNDHVSLIGHVPHADITNVYANADLLIVPSIIAPGGDRDGLPNVILEAMATGVPVVASKLSGIPEAVQDEETGLLVPPGNDAQLAEAIERMVDDRELRRRCIDAARETVSTKFDYRDNAREMYEIILDCGK